MRAAAKIGLSLLIATCFSIASGGSDTAAQDQATADEQKAKLIRSINAIPDLVAAGVLTQEQADSGLTKLKVSLADLILASANPPSAAAPAASAKKSAPAKPAAAATGNHQAPPNKAAPSNGTKQSENAPAQAADPAGGASQPNNSANTSCTGKCSCDPTQSGGANPIPAATIKTADAVKDAKVTGSLSSPADVQVRICLNDKEQTPPATLSADKATFTINTLDLTMKTDENTKQNIPNFLTAQAFTSTNGSKTYGPMSPQFLAGGCKSQGGTGSAPTVDNDIDPGNVAISGTLPSATSGTVRICINDLPQGDTVQVGTDGKFPAKSPTTTNGKSSANSRATQTVSVRVGDQVTAQTVSGTAPSLTYGPVSAAVEVGKCSIASSNPNSSPPTLQPLSTTDTVQGAVKDAKNGTVRICVNDRPVATAGVSPDGSFIAVAKVASTDKVTAQQITSAKGAPTETYGPVSDPATVAAAPTPQTPSWSSLFTRAVAGVQVSAGSSLTTQANLFLEFNVTAPMPLSSELKLGTQRQAGRACVDALNMQSQAFRADPSQRLDSQGIGKACEKYIPQAEKANPSGQTGDGEKEVLRTALDGALHAATPLAFERSASEIRKEFDRDYSPIARRAWFWFNPRISAIPAQASSLLSNITTSSAGTNSLLTAAYDKAIQDIEMTGGVEVFLIGPQHHWAPIGGNAINGLSFVMASGFSTPLSATQNNAQIFSIPSMPSQALVAQLTGNPYYVKNICGTPGATMPCTSAVAFVPPSRTRFFLQEWGGLRWKTYYVKSKSTSGEFGGLCDAKEAGQVCPVFPGTFDVTVGQNSAYSSGQVRGILLRTEAFYPLPFYPTLHVFFTGWIHASGRNQTVQPLLLDTASSSVTVTSPGVQTVVLPVSNRDFYRIGMGLDLVQLVGKLTKQGSQTQAKPAPAGASPTGSSGTGTPSTRGGKTSGTSTTTPSAAAKVSQTGI